MPQNVKSTFSILLNDLVVLTVIAMVSALVALYGLSLIHRKTAYICFAIIAVWGFASIIYQMLMQRDRDKTQARREETKRLINVLLAEGQKLAVSIKSKNPQCDNQRYPTNHEHSEYNQIC